MPGTKKPLRYEGAELRVQIAALFMTLALSLLCIQLWRLQVVHLAEFRDLAEDNRVWDKRLKSERGVIYANDGTVLADNRASADIVFVPGDCPKERHKGVCEALETLLGAPGGATLQKVAETAKEPFTQIIVKRDVTNADLVRVEEHSYMLPGVFTVVHPQRRYLYGKTAGQMLGYMADGGEQLRQWPGYKLGDLIGWGGLERQYEQQLHGRDGYMVITKYAAGQPQLRTDARGIPYIAERDSKGNILSEEGQRQDPLPGKPLYLTLDIGLQARCESLLGGEVGAIVVLDADTGGVLALASTPGYDPNIFVSRNPEERRKPKKKGETAEAETPDKVPADEDEGYDERQALLRDEKRMLHRAVMGQYPPGSVFKVLLASAALEEGAITPQTTFTCPGQFQINGQGRSWSCWQHAGHGTVNVVQALAFSCDVFFYNVGLRLGIDKISEYCHKVGMGEKTGIDIPGEVAGLVGDRKWKREQNRDKAVWDQNWYPGETVNLSVGQGGISTTPLQNTVLIACILNGGYRVRPFVNRELGPQLSERIFSDATIETVVKGMRLCVDKGPPAPTGTGHLVYTPGMVILGKTGSAQVVSLDVLKQYKKEQDIPYEMREHAWFICGVLDRQPKLAVCVLVEHGLHGREAASPLAKAVIDYFYFRNPSEKTIVAREGVAHAGANP